MIGQPELNCTQPLVLQKRLRFSQQVRDPPTRSRGRVETTSIDLLMERHDQSQIISHVRQLLCCAGSMWQKMRNPADMQGVRGCVTLA